MIIYAQNGSGVNEMNKKSELVLFITLTPLILMPHHQDTRFAGILSVHSYRCLSLRPLCLK
jgi:hypothetical protein